MSILYKDSNGNTKSLIPDINNIDDTQATVNTTYSGTKIEEIVGSVADDVADIQGVIPSTASATNKVADTAALQSAALLAFQSVCPNNEIIYDDLGQPSVMVRLPKQSWAQLGIGTSNETFPAWIINGKEVDEIYFSKYQNVTLNDRACSLPARDPRVNITLDQAITASSASSAKGEGWHCMTRLEWMAVALWCLKNGFQPLGNNNYGKDISETIYRAIPSMARDAQGRIQRVATGTGPLSWSHDGTPSGIWDMNGNIWEWNGGIRLVYGELQVLSKDGVTFGNDAADPDNSQAVSSALWYAVDGTTGALINPDGSGTTANSLKASWVNGAFKWITGALTAANQGNHGCDFEAITVDTDVCEAAQHILQALGMYKSDTTAGIYNGDHFWANTAEDEHAFIAGGNWSDGARNGVFADGGYARSNSVSNVGFRASYYKKESD